MVTPIPEHKKFQDSDLMSHAIRMVIPMKREFGLALDVPHFLHDFAYAKDMLDVALKSQDTRLLDNANYLESKMFGPRNSLAKEKPPSAAASPVASANTITPTAASAPASPTATTKAAPKELTEDEMRAELMSKYKGGLR